MTDPPIAPAAGHEPAGRDRADGWARTRPVGILCALAEELAHLEGELTNGRTETIADGRFLSGVLDGRAIVLAEAGIGKVSAAVVATLLADRFGCRALVVSGVAGGLDPTLAVGDVVVATRLIQHDFGYITDDGVGTFQPGEMPLPGRAAAFGFRLAPDIEPRVRGAVGGMQLPPVRVGSGGDSRIPEVRFGTIVTGDRFVSSERVRAELQAGFGALAVEMEGSAVAQVAARFGLPVVVVRALSDLAGHDSGLDFAAFASDAAAGAALLVRAILRVI
jgi:adenosylhomocysteine nucleosidase